MKRILLLFLVLACCLAACQPKGEAPPARPQEISVSAAASLTESFTELVRQFEVLHPEYKVVLNFAGSQALAEQINNGAPVDVFVSASQKTMQSVVDANHISPDAVQLFLSNVLVVAVPANNPGQITQLTDLARPGLKLVIAASEVPVGMYTKEFLLKASGTAGYPSTYSEDVLANVVSYEDNVKSVITKVSLGEADAGIVYSTDAASSPAGTVQTVAIPAEVNVPASYFIAPVTGSKFQAEARTFIEYVLSDSGQAILSSYGFLTVR